MSVGDAFPELGAELERLTFARACRDEMIERFAALDPASSADEITKEYIEVTAAEALDDLRTPGAGDFFGRITDEHRTWYVGRRHIEDDVHDPVVVDWRAPIAAPFYRATGIDPLGLTHRRRFTLDSPGPGAPSTLTAYLDEHLDDPDEAGSSGIPDPVLAEIGAERTGTMREIVATIQAEQDVVIRAPIDQCLVVQGGPGTGKTAVGLHRAAYLLFEHRRRLVRDGVLVVGPNRAFLDYIGHVLPSLGERSVQQRTVADLCIPKVPSLDGVDDDAARRAKGSVEMLVALESASTAHIRRPIDGVRQPFGARTLTFTADEIAEWIDRALDGTRPVNQRRTSLRPIIDRVLLERTGSDTAFTKMTELRKVLGAMWPAMKPVTLVDKLLVQHGHGPGGTRRRWTIADQLLVDEAASLLDGTPFTYGHVVVDEAQDHSAVALRVIGRRSPTGSLTVLGDLAQSTTPAGQDDWTTAIGHLVGDRPFTVEHLTIGYRVPGPILDVANRLLPLTGVDVTASSSVRLAGSPPAHAVDAVEAVLAMRHRHALTGVVAPADRFDDLRDGLAAHGLATVGHVQDLARHEVPIFTPEAVKGLEFDGVVVVDPHRILDGTSRGARLLYVALTRAVQSVVTVGPASLEEVFSQVRV
jgi:DNA helicase IV